MALFLVLSFWGGPLMQVNELLTEAFGRLPDLVRAAVDGLTAEQLCQAPAPGANTVGWLVWHLTRVQDHHVAELLDRDQVWTSGDWPGQFGLDADPADTGYGHGPERVARVRPAGPEVLIDYYAAVSARTDELLRGLTPDDLDRIVDRRWDPPVTLGIRLVSVLDDDTQHVGQAAYLRGLLNR
jgi:Protein of unknown function (DUF664)